MNKLQKLNARLLEAHRQFCANQLAIQERYCLEVKEIHEQKVVLIKKQSICCTFCKKGSRLGDWGYIQTHLYLPPRGHIKEGSWETRGVRVCFLVCPRCSTKNYISTHPKQDMIIGLVGSQGCTLKEIFRTIWGQYGSQDLKQVYPPVS